MLLLTSFFAYYVKRGQLTQFQFPISSEQQKEFLERQISSSFQTRPAKKKKPKLIYLATKYFDQDWSNSFYYFNRESNIFVNNNCLEDNCRVTRNKDELNASDAVIFHVRDIDMENISINRRYGQIWIFYTLEPPWLELVDLKKLNNVFNWTMTYRRDSDIVIKYGIKRTTAKNTSKSINRKKNNAAVWYVSNCCTQSAREKYVRLLKKFFPIEVIGGCGREACRPANSIRCYEIMEKYKFYLSFENAICKDYVTEKFYQVLKYNIIPVVFGDSHYYEIIAPPNSYINAMDYTDPKGLADYLWKVASDENLYNSFFKWKNSFEISFDPWMCSLCEKLHSNARGSVSIVKNLKHWWEDEADCKRWTISGFVPVNSIMFPCYHTHEFN